MDETLTNLINTLMPYVITIVTALLGYVSVSIKNKINQKLDTQQKQQLAQITVDYVQQVYNTLRGEEKLNKAMEQATQLFEQKGIKITEVELRMLLEAAVYGNNKSKYDTEALLEASTTKIMENVEVLDSKNAIEEAE